MAYSYRRSIHIHVVNIVVTEEEGKDHSLTKSDLFRNGMISFFCIQFHKRRLSLTYKAKYITRPLEKKGDIRFYARQILLCVRFLFASRLC